MVKSKKKKAEIYLHRQPEPLRCWDILWKPGELNLQINLEIPQYVVFWKGKYYKVKVLLCNIRIYSCFPTVDLWKHLIYNYNI